MSKLIDLLVIGAGPAGLMAAKRASELGLNVVLVEKNNNFKQIRRACSAQFILDYGYQNEFIKLENNKILFTKNNFEVNYDGKLVDIKNKYYKSPNGHRIHFALPNQKPFALKFDKRKLLEDLFNECISSGVDARMSTIATKISDNNKYVTVTLKSTKTKYSIDAKKVIIAEGVNARLTNLLRLDKKRTHFATALTAKYILEGISDIEPNSWNLFYGKAYFSNAPVIIGPSLYGDNTFEVTISGSINSRPDSIYQNVITKSPIKDKFKNVKLIDKHACLLKAFSSIKKPYTNNILSIGDSSAFVEVEVQGALMCGYHAANAILDELKGKKGFKSYANWWKNAFEFNSDEYLLVSQGYALVPTYTDDELDYLFALIENEVLDGTYSQYRTPKLIWDAILKHKDKIKNEQPIIYQKIKKLNSMTLTNSF